MTDTYTWTDNAMQNGATCNTDTANDNLMYLRYDCKKSVDVTYDSTNQALIFDNIEQLPTEYPNGNFITRISNKGQVNYIGGANFDEQWVDSVYTLVSDGTLSGGSRYAYSLSSYLTDNRDYEVMFTGICRSTASSGKVCGLTLYPGNVTAGVAANGWRLGKAVARTNAAVGAGGSAIIPISASSKYITVYTQDSSTDNTTVTIKALKYRKLGAND